MALNDNYKLTDDQDIYYAEVLNQLVQSTKGNSIFSGGEITGVANTLASPGTHAQVSLGSVLINGVRQELSSLDIDLNTEYDTLNPDEGMFVYVYANSSGVINTLAGTKGDNNPSILFFPPDFSGLPADCCVLGRIVLAEGDTIIDSNNIKNLRVKQRPGTYILLAEFLSAPETHVGLQWTTINNTRIFDNGLATGIELIANIATLCKGEIYLPPITLSLNDLSIDNVDLNIQIGHTTLGNGANWYGEVVNNITSGGAQGWGSNPFLFDVDVINKNLMIRATSSENGGNVEDYTFDDFDMGDVLLYIEHITP